MTQEQRRPVVREFIDLYKRLPCLWKVDSKEYSDRHMKNAAYSLLATKLAELEPGANRLSVVKKINNLRTNYRKEKRKIRAAELSGDVFRPSLWYYRLLNFLDTQDDSNIDVIDINAHVEAQFTDSPPRNFDDDEDDDAVDGLGGIDSNSPPLTKAKFEIAVLNGSPSEYGEMSSGLNEVHPRKRKLDDALNTAGRGELQTVRCDDRHDAFGRSIAFKLRALPSDQRIFAERLINESLFEAEMGNLNRNCRVQLGEN